MWRMIRLLGLAVGVVTGGVAVWAAGNPPEKKLIAVGWDMPNAERLRANLAIMEQAPLQGCSVRFAGPGNKPNLWFSFTREPYDPQVVAQFLADLQAVKPQQLTDRFLLLNANPGDVDWFDDVGWKVIVDHWRTGARVARAGGLKGIMFDPEAYRPPHSAFDWSRQPQADKYTFSQYYDKARQRGREIMTVVAQEYPDATILALWLLSGNKVAAGSSDPMEALTGNPYGLMPAFVNGWLDKIPPAMTLVDGCEEAYRYNSRLDYLTGAHLIRGKCQRLVAPENLAKYRAQVQVGFGVYLDAYVNPPTNSWYINPGTQTPVWRLADNVATAVEIADEYVWIYGEQCSWWPSPAGDSDKVRWPQKLPGIERALRLAVDPVGLALEMLDQPGDRKSVMANGDFTPAAGVEPVAGQPPTSWTFWQGGVSKGRPGWDTTVGHKAPGSATMSGVRWGCVFQAIPAKPGERYAVGAWYRVQGRGAPSLTVRWQNLENRWHAEALDRLLSTVRTAGEWKLMAGIATVPEDTGRLVVMLGANGQQSEADVVWWDEVTVLRVE